jgi:precorrin-6A/cobalt-precorrin-6A reductase
MVNLWLIAGTSEGIALATQLGPLGLPTQVTVTTPSAAIPYGNLVGITVTVVKFMTQEEARIWAIAHQIIGILDASHPFATQISTQAMAIATQLDIPYFRVERPEVVLPPTALTISFADLAALFESGELAGERVLLTLGSQWLHHFREWQDRATLFARILPTAIALDLAKRAGFQRDRLIALQPPITWPLEVALWQQWEITKVVTKASGEAGGELAKLQASEYLKVPLLVLQRPALVYPEQTGDLAIALQRCQTWFSQTQ